MILVEQALDAITQRDIEQADLHAVPIALAAQMIAISKGGKEVEPSAFNPFGVYLYKQQARATIEPETARKFLELTAAGVVPAWVVGQIDVKQMRAAAGDDEL